MVDKTIGDRMEPDDRMVDQAVSRIAEIQQEKEQIQLRAQQALEEAARLMAEAKQREKLAQEEALRAQRELEAQQLEVLAASSDTQRLKTAQAAKARALAELESREASRKKAEQEAALQAARLAAAEEAEAEAARRVAENKRLQALRSKELLIAKAREAQEISEAANQRAADATASAEARSHEARLAEMEGTRIRETLAHTTEAIQSMALNDPIHPVSTHPSGIHPSEVRPITSSSQLTPVPGGLGGAYGQAQSYPQTQGLGFGASPGFAPAAGAGGVYPADHSVAGSSMRPGVSGAGIGAVEPVSSHSSGIPRMSTMTFEDPTRHGEFPYILHLDFTKFVPVPDFRDERLIGKNVMVRATLGGIESRSKAFRWPKDGKYDNFFRLETDLPVVDPAQLLEIELFGLGLDEDLGDVYDSNASALHGGVGKSVGPASTTGAAPTSPAKSGGILGGLFHHKEKEVSSTTTASSSSSSSTTRPLPQGTTATTREGVPVTSEPSTMAGTLSQPAGLVSQDIERGGPMVGKLQQPGSGSTGHSAAMTTNSTSSSTSSTGTTRNTRGWFASLFHKPLTSFSPDQAHLLGKCAINLQTLLDGHISRDNQLNFEGIPGTLLLTLHMVPRHLGGAGITSTPATTTGASTGAGPAQYDQKYRDWSWNQPSAPVRGAGMGEDYGHGSSRYWEFANPRQ